MIKTFVFSLGALQTNAYLLVNEATRQSLVIDPGMNPASLLRRIAELEVTVEAILLTHAHFDHIAGLDEVRKQTGAPVYLHPLEADWLTEPAKNGSLRWSEVTPPIATTPAEYDLADGQVLKLLGVSLKVMHTPGHSPGSVSFLISETSGNEQSLFGNQLFAGDVLFRLSVGRTDLLGGKFRDLMASVHDKLFQLPADTVVYPGHGPKTTIGYEQQNNPYV